MEKLKHGDRNSRLEHTTSARSVSTFLILTVLQDREYDRNGSPVNTSTRSTKSGRVAQLCPYDVENDARNIRGNAICASSSFRAQESAIARDEFADAVHDPGGGLADDGQGLLRQLAGTLIGRENKC